MAGPTILVRILGDARGFTAEVDKATDSTSKLAKIGSSVGSAIGNTLAGAMRLAATAATVAGGAMVAFGVDSFKTSARVGEMDATLRALAKGNDDVYRTMTASVDAIRDQGIEYGVAQNLVAQFSRNNLDLAKSTDLARVAQDAAVISGQNSSETLDQLIHGITTQNSLVLRNAGVNVQAGKAMDDYARSVGKSARDLSEAERAQAVLNAVIAAGGPIAGAYAAAMTEPGKVLRSFPRLFDNIKISAGEGLVKAFGPAILKAYDLVKAFSEQIKEGGRLRPVIDALIAVIAPLGQKIAEMAGKATEFIKAIPPATVAKITDAIGNLGGQAAGAGTAIGIMGAKNIPILGDLLGGINPLVGGFAAMVLSTDEGRGALALLWDTIKPLLPDLLRLAEQLIKLALDAVVPLLPPIMQLVREALPPLLAMVTVVADAVGFWLRVLAPLAPQLVAIAALIGGWVVVQWALNVAMTANPIGLIIAGIVALTAVVILIVRHFDTFRAVAVAAFQWVLNIAQQVWGWISSNWPLLLAVLTGPVGIAVGLIVRNFDTIRSFVAGVVDAVAGFFSGLPGRIGAALAGLGAALSAPFRAGLDAIRNLWNSTLGGKGFEIPGWVPGLGGKSFKFPTLAAGGVVSVPTLALVGEGFGREIVAPEPLMREIVRTESRPAGPVVTIAHATFTDQVDIDVFMDRVAWAVQRQAV